MAFPLWPAPWLQLHMHTSTRISVHVSMVRRLQGDITTTTTTKIKNRNSCLPKRRFWNRIYFFESQTGNPNCENTLIAGPPFSAVESLEFIWHNTTHGRRIRRCVHGQPNPHHPYAFSPPAGADRGLLSSNIICSATTFNASLNITSASQRVVSSF